MTTSNILFIGMDVHKESIEIALADGANQEVRRYMRCANPCANGCPWGKTCIFATRQVPVVTSCIATWCQKAMIVGSWRPR